LEQGAKENNPQLVANPIDESDCQVGSNWPVGAMFFDFFISYGVKETIPAVSWKISGLECLRALAAELQVAVQQTS
jgi:hypothetical protein